MTDTVDVQATPVDPLADKIMTLKFSVSDINGILNALINHSKPQPFCWQTLLPQFNHNVGHRLMR